MTVAYYPNSATTGTLPTTMQTFFINTGTGSSNVILYNNPCNSPHQSTIGGGMGYIQSSGKLTIEAGYDLDITLPDDAVISVKSDGSYKITDENGKIKYKGNPLREFNPYVNASDLLEEFVDFIASVGGITKQSFFNLPIELFIRWLIVRAAEADGDDLPEDHTTILQHPALLSHKKAKIPPRCKFCGRFITKKRESKSIFFCSTEHFSIYSDRAMA